MTAPRLAITVRRSTSPSAHTASRQAYAEIWRRAPGIVAVRVVSQLLAATQTRAR